MTRVSRRRQTVPFVVGMAAALALLGPITFTTQPAASYWSVASSGGSAGAARAASVNNGGTPATTVMGNSVDLGWPAATTSTGSPVTGYSVGRYDWDGRAQAIGGTCLGVVDATTCTDASVPVGRWSYAVTPRYQDWTGRAGTTTAQVGAATPTVEIGGDPSFASDSIADSSPKQPRWHSIPGSRLVMGRGTGTPINSQLALGMGAYFATGPLTLDGILRTTVGPVAGVTTNATSVTSTWYPYQLAFNPALRANRWREVGHRT